MTFDEYVKSVPEMSIPRKEFLREHWDAIRATVVVALPASTVNVEGGTLKMVLDTPVYPAADVQKAIAEAGATYV